jgi:hypothetical protein
MKRILHEKNTKNSLTFLQTGATHPFGASTAIVKKAAFMVAQSHKERFF